VPACAADAERVHVGAEPDTRKVPVVPAGAVLASGPGYSPYAPGYFSPYAGSGLLPSSLLGAVMFGVSAAGDGDGSDGVGDGGAAVGRRGQRSGGEGADARWRRSGGTSPAGDWGGGLRRGLRRRDF
jgi:hypothetical protein